MALVLDGVSNVRPNINIYRFKFSDEIISILKSFAKLHQFDDRISFKEAWVDLLKLYSEEIDIERKRLETLGYIDDIESKMFKSSRYYFRKKLSIETMGGDIAFDNAIDTVDTVDTKKKIYISLDPEILEAIDLHIKRNCDNENYRPAWGWDNFCENYKICVAAEIIRIIRESNLSNAVATNKLKKAYKNKYFQYTRVFSKE
jgi:hypothetical protein